MSKERAKKRQFQEQEIQKCKNKRTYKDRKTAKAAAKDLNKRHDFCQRVYKCPYCGFYHLATDKEKVKKKEEKKMYDRKNCLTEEDGRVMLDSLCEEYVIASKQSKNKSELSEEIKGVCKRAGIFETENYVISITDLKGGWKFDAAAFKKENPDMYEKYCTKWSDDSLKLSSVERKEAPIEYIG